MTESRADGLIIQPVIFDDRTETYVDADQAVKIIKELEAELARDHKLGVVIQVELHREREASNQLRLALQTLVNIKRHKDDKGKDEFYLREQPLAWEKAKSVLEPTTALDGRIEPDQITVSFGNGCLWHQDCPENSHGSPMKEVDIDESAAQTLQECCSCGVRAYYPHGSIGPVVVDVVEPDKELP